jgi:hypothetical protein
MPGLDVAARTQRGPRPGLRLEGCPDGVRVSIVYQAKRCRVPHSEGSAMTDRFSERHGYRRPAPPRVSLEEAPEDLRVVLRSILIERGGLFAYYKLCEKLHRQRDPNIWAVQQQI